MKKRFATIVLCICVIITMEPLHVLATNSSEDDAEDVATVVNGAIMAVGVGTATIQAKCGEAVASCVVHVEAAKLGDVPEDSWQYEPAMYVYEKGIMTGKGFDVNGDVVFEPDSVLTREQFAQVLYSAEGKETVVYTDKFTDVVAGKWYTDAVLWAADKGIVSGYGSGQYGVGDSITREQLAAMLYKYAVYKGYDTTARAEFVHFKDAQKISSWATEQLSWAVANGVMSGKGERLDPTGSATRAECAAMLKTFMEKFDPETTTPARAISWHKVNAASSYDSYKNLTGFLVQAMFYCSTENYEGFTAENSFNAKQGHKPFFVGGKGYEYMYFSFWIENDPSLEGWHTLTLNFDGRSESVEIYLKYLGDYSQYVGTPNSVSGLGWEVSEWRVVQE